MIRSLLDVVFHKEESANPTPGSVPPSSATDRIADKTSELFEGAKEAFKSEVDAFTEAQPKVYTVPRKPEVRKAPPVSKAPPHAFFPEFLPKQSPPLGGGVVWMKW